MGPRLTLILGSVALAVVAVGWFLISSKVAHTDPPTAARESIGAILAFLLVASVIGSIANHRGTDD